MRNIPLYSLVEDRVLVGRSKAERHLPPLMRQMEPPGVLVLDFTKIQVLTTSYFFAALWPFWTREHATGPSVFPLVANAPSEVEEEISFAMTYRRMGAWRGCFRNAEFIPNGWLGVVDDGLNIALDQAVSGQGLSAVDLSKRDEINPTTWNNRLASLHKQRLLVRQQSGRKRTYYAPWKAPRNG